MYKGDLAPTWDYQSIYNGPVTDELGQTKTMPGYGVTR
jgi:hypothetical protein